MAARHPASHSHFLSSTAWREKKLEKLTDHAGMTKVADENLLHRMAFMSCRVVHA